MNLCVRDVFERNDVRYRLVHLDVPQKRCWIIAMDDHNAWPFSVPVEELENLERQTADVVQAKPPSQARLKKLDRDYELVKRVLETNTDLFDAVDRRLRLEWCAEELRSTSRTLQKLLRRYWQRGLTKSALLSDFNKCGRRQGGSTAGRGRKPRGSRLVYQIATDDIPKFERAFKHYFDDKRLTLAEAYQWLRENYFTFTDGNGAVDLLPIGECPSQRQFQYLFKNYYPIDVRARKREGDREYTKTYKPKLSDTIADCLGIGHRYEIDATIADVQIVHSTDRTTIIRKATLYLIVDRKSRLIVGFYIGLDAASWETAVEAMVSIVENKQALCERYRVKYDPADWPADGILPAEFLGDRGEMISLNSGKLADELGITISNTRALVPNHKPNVETRFKLITSALRGTAPGYDPPENFAKRRTAHYEKEACLTLEELGAEILQAIIMYNRKPLLEYARSTSEVLRGVEPSPISLWNDGLKQTGNKGHRSSVDKVRLALLPVAQAKLTHEGLLFQKLYYVSDDPRLIRAFVKARDGRESISISYDRRSVDLVYVHLPDGVVIATLSPRHHSFRGLSFREAEVVRTEESRQKDEFQHKRAQVEFDRHELSKDRIREAERARNELGNLSVRQRKANTVAAREAEKRQENIDRTARLEQEAGIPAHASTPASATVTGLPVQKKPKLVETNTPNAAQTARRKMANS